MEYGEQTKAINLFVDQINNAGGINGRKINPIIVQFDPARRGRHAGAVQALDRGQPGRVRRRRRRRDVERGQPALRDPAGPDPVDRAVDDHVTNWTDLGSPYLWWTGPTTPPCWPATGPVGPRPGLPRRHGKKVGVVVGTGQRDQAALNEDLLPDLKKVGVTPVVVTVASGTDETATTELRRPAGRRAVQGGRRARR